MLNTISDVMLECIHDFTLTNKDFHGLFTKEIEGVISLLLNHFEWSKCKIHIFFALFKQMCNELTKRSDSSLPTSTDDITYLSGCAYALEK